MWAKPTVTIWTPGIKCIMLGTVWLHLSLSFIPSLFGGQPAPSLSRAQFPVNACRLPGLSCCQLSAISLLERIAIKTSLFLRSWKKTDLPYTNHQIPPPPHIFGMGWGVLEQVLKINICLQQCYDFANCQQRCVICGHASMCFWLPSWPFTRVSQQMASPQKMSTRL